MNISLVKVYSKNKQHFTKNIHYDLFMNEDAKNIAKNLDLLMKYFKYTPAKAGFLLSPKKILLF